MNSIIRDKFIFSLICFCFFITSITFGVELKFNTQDFPPFSYGKNCKYSERCKVEGPAADIIKAVCNETGDTAVMNIYPWRRAQEYVRLGYANAMFLIGWNKKRSKWLYFSPPVLETEYGFFVKDDNPLVYKKPTDVKGYTIGVYGPSNTSNSLYKIKAEIKDLTVDLRPNDETGFRKLSLGRVDGVFSNRDVGYALIKKNMLSNIRYAGTSKKLKYYIGFSMDHTERKIVDKFNKAYRKLYNKGVIKKILKKYSMEPARL